MCTDKIMTDAKPYPEQSIPVIIPEENALARS